MKVQTLSVVACMACASAANATDYSFGDVTGVQVNGVHAVGMGAFTDNLFFNVSTPSIGSGVASDVFVNAFGGAVYDIAGMGVSLWLDLGTVGVSDGSDVFMTPISGNGDYFQDSGSLAIADYYFQVTGTGVGTLGGQYFFNAAAQPIPEAETWAMILIGLGLLGLRMRNRNATGRFTA